MAGRLTFDRQERRVGHLEIRRRLEHLLARLVVEENAYASRESKCVAGAEVDWGAKWRSVVGFCGPRGNADALCNVPEGTISEPLTETTNESLGWM